MANSIAVSSRWTLPASWAWRTASSDGGGALVEAVELPPGEAPGQQRRRDELALAADLGDRHRLLGELHPAGRIGIRDEDRANMLRIRTW